MLPEQFTGEWDYIFNDPEDPPAGMAPLRVAGKYDMASNVFQLGCTMFACITRAYPLDPPSFRRVPGLAGGFTLGSSLNDYDGFDQELCTLVMRCMMYYPTERPELAELDTLCTARIAQFSVDENRDARRWATKFFYEPRYPEPFRLYDPDIQVSWYIQALCGVFVADRSRASSFK